MASTLSVAYANYLENVRSNKAKEAETHRSNVAVENETYRSNLAKEMEANRSNLAKELENYRHNVATEGLEGIRLAEVERHNRASEKVDRKNAETNRMNAVTRENELDETVRNNNLRHLSNIISVAGPGAAIEELEDLGKDQHALTSAVLTGWDYGIKSANAVFGGISSLYGAKYNGAKADYTNVKRENLEILRNKTFSNTSN